MSLTDLAGLLSDGDVVVVSGAGLSTDSGLPDYRGSGGSEKPSVDYDMFVGLDMWQRWVWQRNQESWKALDTLPPTIGHRILADWERRGIVTGTATQNIDGMHFKAGSKKVAEMHGSFTRVTCIDCNQVTPRSDLDPRLRELNPLTVDDPNPANAAILAEADRASAEKSTFVPAPCANCGGILKPDIVFFGEGVQAIDQAFDYAREAKTILVLGSSLLVMTGMWVVTQGLSSGANLAIINRGPTQADRYADIRIDADISESLKALDGLLKS
ncbi:MAG: Sir2 family NAD-dependent protein deacetylase [Flaviflexus sp.]|uniref:Sir2 family NAD-dependent protein deacetylase n=1 Tax=Flaviflexus sp. TaxID=1969482 RepID=UPI003F8F319D